MTLVPYDSERLDTLALRLFDLCARLRTLSHVSRGEQLPSVQLHDRKALEWIANLEDWMFNAEAEMNRSIHKHQGQRKARETKSGRRK